MFNVASSRLDWVRADSVARGALRWWLEELAGMIPDHLRRRVAGFRHRLLLVIDATGASLVEEVGDSREKLGRVDLQSGQAAPIRRILDTAKRRAKSKTNDVVVCLPADRALSATVSFPLATERNLAEVIGFEFERLVPFTREEVYYAYRLLGRDRATRSLQVELHVVRREPVEEISQLAARVGLNVIGLEAAGTTAGSPAIPIMLHDNGRANTQRRTVGAMIAIACITAGLALASIVIPIVQARSTLASLTAQVAEARHQADASLAVQKQIDAKIQDQQFLVAKKQRTLTLTEILNIVTQLTPDDTWLSEMQVTGEEIHLVGVSASATQILSLIDQSPSFHNAAFRSSITHDPTLNGERFDIAANVVPRSKP
jgi:general secretion pathway protein L